MKTKAMVLALIAVTAGVFVHTRPSNKYPSDFRDAVGSGVAAGQLQGSARVEFDKGDAPTPSAPASAEKTLYLDPIVGYEVEICKNISESEVQVSPDCSGWFKEKHARKLSELVKQVPGGVAPGKEYAIVPSGALVRLVRLYENGRAKLYYERGDSYYYFPANRLELEMAAGEELAGFKKGQTVCMKEYYEVEEETGGVYGIGKPFPEIVPKGDRVVLKNLFKSGFARAKTVDSSRNMVLTWPVDIKLVEPCGKK
ncbi:MAG: hypothetical protein AUJ51_00410 [Elusimicrobia bacterium CG1_02_56_21]|nr:MAG: hypothetical protein AUJ51_00410 [Elusimicrobia bacterium CG1_02_56_21]